MPEDTPNPASPDPAAEAAQTLREMSALTERTRRASSAGVLGPCLMLCGLSWLVTLGSAQLVPEHAWLITLTTCLACGGGIVWRILSQARTGLVLSQQTLGQHRRTLLFWLFLFAQGLAIAWVCGLGFDRPVAVILTFVLLTMLGFIATGLFLGRTALVVLGALLSVLSLAGSALLPMSWFLPWNALVVGLGMILCGHHIWRRWA